ncbi:MAG: hypothetical protein AAFX85_20675, partial [Pseudomonadota bacterium]
MHQCAWRLSGVALFLIGGVLAGPSVAQPIDSERFDALEWREIGPWRGGRVTAVAGVPGRDREYFMGAAGGGVWHTSSAGIRWDNVSDDDFGVGSIGAVAVAPSDRN